MQGGYTKKKIQDALIAALLPLSVQGGGYLRVLKPYSGELDSASLLADALQLPAVFVSYASSTYGPGPCLSATETLSFNVIVLCRNGSEPDALRVLEDARGMLHGGTLGLSVSPLRLLRESLLSSTQETTALSAVYSLTQTVNLPTQERSN